MFFSSYCLFAQDSNVKTEKTSSSVEAEQAFVINSSKNVDNDGTSQSANGNNTTSTVGLFVRLILVLIAVVALFYGFMWLLKKISNPKPINDPYLKRTAAITLAPGKTVQVVTLKDSAYLLGVTDSKITLLEKLDDKELIDAMNLSAEEADSAKPKDFASLLSAFTKSSSQTEDFLRKRRENFGNSEHTE